MIIDGHTSLTQFIRIKEGDVLTLGLEGITVSYKLNSKVIRRFTQWNIRAWRLCIKFGTGETHITGLTVNGEPIPISPIRAMYRLRIPRQTRPSSRYM